MAEALRSEAAVPLEVSGLTKRFPGILALDDVSVAFRPGEIHALVGQNGAGKSTLINILSGMLQADAGEVRVGGRLATIASTRHAVDYGIATVYQELSLLPNLSVAQNLALGREPRRFGLLDVAAMQRAAAQALDRVAAGAIRPEASVAKLSVAERQLVEIAKALSRNPRILILDEPTAPLAKREADRLFGILDALRRSGLTIIFVSHRFREILDHCDRGTVLRNGQKIVTTELVGWSEAALAEAMIGRKAEMFGRQGSAQTKSLPRPALRVSNLRWKDKVQDVSFVAAAGEIVGITGLLGAGQNEIGRLLGGDLHADAGAMEINGQAVVLNGPADANRAGLCLLTDDRKSEGILPNLPVRENVVLPSLAVRQRAGAFVKRSAENTAVAAALARFNVVARSPEAPIRTLSGGNQQKALLARWHLVDADVFALIEPTRGVDVGARADIYRRLEALRAAGKAILVISSDIPEVLALADRILVVCAGRIAAEVAPQETDEERLNLLVQGAA